MDKYQRLLVVFEVRHTHVIAFLIVNINGSSFSGKVVAGILWIFNSNKVDNEGDGPIVGSKMKQSFFPVDF